MYHKEILARIGKGMQLITTITFSVVFVVIIGYLFWVLAGKMYINLEHPAGGDFYNFYTYVVFFRKYLTLPPVGWMHWWNEGTPVIGGYPFLHFYFMHVLYRFFDTMTAVQWYAIVSLLFFFVSSFIVFLVAGRSIILAFLLTIILIYSKGVYFSLFAGGFIASSNTQWLLPTVFIFAILFLRSHNMKYLVMSGIIAGISILSHQPTSILLIVPMVAIVVFFSQKGWKKKVKNLAIFFIISLSIGSMNLIYLYNQIFLGQGNSLCNSQLCWGIYPQHFEYFHILTGVTPGIFVAIALLTKIFKKKLNLTHIAIFAFVLLIPILYATAAYYHLIDTMANSYFPRRVYWAISFYAFLLTAVSFRSVRDVLLRTSFILVIASAASLYWFYSMHPDAFILRLGGERPDAYPRDVERYIIPKYKRFDLAYKIPSWVSQGDTNYRFHSFNQELIVWWNSVIPVPSTLGFSNYPVGVHRDWLYFFQTSVSFDQLESVDARAIKNRSRFLLDALGIGFIENSGPLRMHESILSDTDLIKRREGEWSIAEVSKNLVTPIVYPTNTPAVLFVGDDEGYGTFIRASALANLNSRIIIPVKGGEDFDKLSLSELRKFAAVILYRYQGKDWSKLKKYIDRGGGALIESGSSLKTASKLLPDIFPINAMTEEKNTGRLWDEQSVLGIETTSFSELLFERSPWKIMTAISSDLRPWARPLLTHEDKIIMAKGSLGKGKVVWSGWNFPYHIVNKNNVDEATLFGNIIHDLTDQKNTEKEKFTIERKRPEAIKITAGNITGIYFKENYHQGWKGRAPGKKLKVYPAGLDFMYIPVSQDPTNTIVSIYYTGGFVNWIFFLISILTFFFSIAYILFSKPFQIAEGFMMLHGGRIKKSTIQYWNKED